VATISPPMMATAIGPQKTLRVSGIIARMAAAAVSMIGRKRRTVEPTIASQGGMPAFSVLLDLVDENHRVAHDHSRKRDDAEVGDEAEGNLEEQQRAATPINPSGAVSSTSNMRPTFCNWIISR
jgi:hypothetical protein